MSNKIQTKEFGDLELDQKTNSYVGSHALSFIKLNTFFISSTELQEGIHNLSIFLEWLIHNEKEMKHRVEAAIDNNDLIIDEVWDDILGQNWPDRWDEVGEGFLSDYISFNAVNYYDKHIHLWVDTSGLHTDHLVHAHILCDGTFKIDYCEV